jgi:hypothetical protein
MENVQGRAGAVKAILRNRQKLMPRLDCGGRRRPSEQRHVRTAENRDTWGNCGLARATALGRARRRSHRSGRRSSLSVAGSCGRAAGRRPRRRRLARRDFFAAPPRRKAHQEGLAEEDDLQQPRSHAPIIARRRQKTRSGFASGQTNIKAPHHLRLANCGGAAVRPIIYG